MKGITLKFGIATFLALITAWLVISLPFTPVMSRPLPNPAKASEPAFTLNEYSVATAHITLPFHLIDGLLLIDGKVNNIPGKFMFDTGTEFPFLLNNHLLPLGKETLLGQGAAASGQEIVLYSQPEPIESLELADQIRFENLRSLPHTDFGFIEQGLVEHFLGMMGHGFNRNYLFVINYDTQTLDLYSLAQDEATLATYLDPDRILTTIHFVPTGVEGKIPEATFLIGDEPITAFFDTGNRGQLKLTAALKTTLERAGYLKIEPSDSLYGTHEPYTRCSLKGLRYGNQTLAELHNLDLKIGQENRLGMGYQFFKHYVTAWNYNTQTITLLLN